VVAIGNDILGGVLGVLPEELNRGNVAFIKRSEVIEG
jgi:hypothetical protein